MSLLPHLHRDLMQTVAADHGGVGSISVYRAFGPPHAGVGQGRDDAADDDARVVHIDLVVVPAGCSIGEHRHGADRETYVVLSGEAQMRRGDELLRVQTGDVIVNPPFCVHSLTNDSLDEVHLLVYEIAPVTR
ncbi:MAG: cupin domain-containing protein [Nakamurella sp.]